MKVFLEIYKRRSHTSSSQCHVFKSFHTSHNYYHAQSQSNDFRQQQHHGQSQRIYGVGGAKAKHVPYEVNCVRRLIKVPIDGAHQVPIRVSLKKPIGTMQEYHIQC